MKLNIGENIRKNRTRLGRTQMQLAERLGTSVQSVSRWESGGGYPDMELLPVLARTFAVSVDELMGYNEEKKKTWEEMQKLADEIFHAAEPSEKRAVEYLRTVRLDYLEEASFLLGTLLSVLPEKLNHSAEFMEELRLLTKEYCSRVKRQSERGRLIELLAIFENDEKFKELVDTYSSNPTFDLSVQGLYLTRARARRDHALHAKLTNEKTVLMLRNYLADRVLAQAEYRPDGEYDYTSLPVTDPAVWRSESERRLAVLHAHTGIVPRENYPVSGDGRLDMWAFARTQIGELYAAQLSALGEYERALTVLEDVAGLVEQATDFPDMEYFLASDGIGFHPERCPDVLSRMPAPIESRAYRVPHFRGRKCVLFHLAGALENGHIVPLGIMDFHAALLTDKSPVPRQNFRVPWLDPIRDHPRYKAVVERIQICKDRLTNTKEERV